MFEESLVESTGLLRTRNRAPVYISMATQAAVLAAIVAVPLLHPEIITIHTPMLKSITAPVPPKAPPPPPQQPVHLENVSTVANAPAAPTSAPQIHREALEIFSSDKTSVDGPLLPMNPGIMSNSNVPFAIGGPPTGTTVNVASSVPATRSSPLSVSTGVSNGLLLAPIQPVYPQIARMTRIEGVVVIQAIISKQGRIESARLVSGPPLLVQAALDAVRNARYRPYMLNNEPTEVQTTFSVNFRLSN